ncbi:MAG: hypothetical protein GY839_09170 [candidate division Zixibacteria bacterium]|nr:hypothetical protein [candidate division Zixibacteria bacterium]
MARFYLILFLLASFLLSMFSPVIAQDCPSWVLGSEKGNKLYLYFPTAVDNTFPEYHSSLQTSPLNPFDVSDLDATIGTTAQLRDIIFDIVTDDYCEFNVEVIMTTASPTTSGSRWQIVGVGSDDEVIGTSIFFGVAQAVDINDADGQDYARVYAGSFGTAYGGTGGELNGANSTLERWARMIGHTATHEAGHNYGLGHGDSAPITGEDQQSNHIMATYSTGLTGEERATIDRHFSNTSYEILGHNIGLNVYTVHNWDFVNPNSSDAHSLVLTILSPASSLSISWYYTGSRCPWTNPSISSTGSTQSFQGTTYNVFEMVYSAPQAWENGANGVVPPAAELHIGSAFNETDLVIVSEATLRDASNNDLALHPRFPGYDAGAADMETGDFAMSFFNMQSDMEPLIIRDIEVSFLPRMASIESMIDGDTLVDTRGNPVEMRRPGKSFKPQRSLEVRDKASFKLARLVDPRHVDITYDSTDCEEGIREIGGVNDMVGGELMYCPHGTALSLFPTTFVYVVASVIDPNAKHWDVTAGDFATGPLEMKLFYQFAGFVPDFNDNGIDDILDIRHGTSIDENGNGIPDEAEDRGTEFPWWWLLIILLIILILIWLLLRLINK